MQVLECDAKKLLSRHAIASPPGIVAATPEEAEAAATRKGRGARALPLGCHQATDAEQLACRDPPSPR